MLGVDREVPVSLERRLNVTAQPRSELVLRLLSNRGRVKRALRAAVPFTMRTRLRRLLENLNAVPFLKKPELDPGVSEPLRDFFRPEVERLEGILQRDLSIWKTGRLP